MRQESPRFRVTRWRRRLFAAAVVCAFHLALFGVIARDWGQHRTPVRIEAVEITLERQLARRPMPEPEADRRQDDPALVPAPAAPSTSAPPASELAPTFAGARPVAPPAVAAGPPAPSVALNIGCLGRSRESMTPAERKRCDEERMNMARPGGVQLPRRVPPTALDREFAAAWAKRRENDPRPRAPRPTRCQLANITNCEPEDSTWVLFDGHGTGTAQVLKRRFTDEKLPEKPPAKAAPVFGREESTFTPAPMK